MKQQIQSRPYSPQNPPTYIPNNEFYLKDLLKLLWEGKLIVIAVTALFTASSIGFALLAQEWWSSTAKVAEAQPQDMAAYQQEVRQFQPVFNVYQDDGTVLVSKELNELVDSEVLFKRFINTFNSSNNKRFFLDNNPEFQAFKSTLCE